MLGIEERTLNAKARAAIVLSHRSYYYQRRRQRPETGLSRKIQTWFDLMKNRPGVLISLPTMGV